MIDLRELAPAAWGLAGALAYGFYGVIQAFRVPGADVGARRKALFDLALAPVLGPWPRRSSPQAACRSPPSSIPAPSGSRSASSPCRASPPS